MSSRLTLLFLCDHSEQYSLFISALATAHFDVLAAREEEEARLILSASTIDAIIIVNSRLKEVGALGRRLKRAAPQTPVLRFGDGIRGPQHGVDAVYSADLQDEVLAHAAAIFLKGALSGEHSHPKLRVPSEASFVTSDAKQTATV